MADRKAFLALCSSLGFGATLLPGAALALAEQKVPLTRELIDNAARIADVKIADEYKDLMLETLTEYTADWDALYALHIPYTVAPALIFDPVPAGMKLETERKPMSMSAAPSVRAPADIEDVAFASVRELGELIRTRQVTSLALTQMYIARLKRYDPALHFVITLTEERALAQARAADREIAAGSYRGPLHGIPWGAKDLLAVKGYRTTWGAGGFETQTIDSDATVVQRLDAAGAVLIAKLAMGALARGDKWFGGQTRSPWNPKQGSGGSSAGPGSAVGAGCVAFALGTETNGSITNPATRNNVTGLRPTFGFAPRTGAMALAWSMDKLGPMCRSAEDCAIVFSAIYGPDGQDRSVQNAAFNWDAAFDWRKLRIGYLKSDFETPTPLKPIAGKDGETAEAAKIREAANVTAEFARKRADDDRRYERATLDKLRSMGVTLVPVELPAYPYQAIRPILATEAAAMFDELTRTGRDKLLTQQSKADWPNTFRVARFVPGVEYLQANRARAMAIEDFAKLFNSVDIIVASSTSTQVVATNLTGHPALIVPNGVRGGAAPVPRTLPSGEQELGGPGTPVSITFLGQLYSDARLIAFGKAYQEATGFHLAHPKL